MPYNARTYYRRLYARERDQVIRLKACIRTLRKAIDIYKHPDFGSRDNIVGRQKQFCRDAVGDASALYYSNGRHSHIPEIWHLRVRLGEMLNECDRQKIGI